MLNHETTSAYWEKQKEREEYDGYDVSEIKYSKGCLIINGISYPVKRQKATYYQGSWVCVYDGYEYDAYTLKALKAKIHEDL